MRLAQLGADVTIASRNPEKAFAAVEDIKAQAPGAKVGAGVPPELACTRGYDCAGHVSPNGSDRVQHFGVLPTSLSRFCFGGFRGKSTGGHCAQHLESTLVFRVRFRFGALCVKRFLLLVFSSVAMCFLMYWGRFCWRLERVTQLTVCFGLFLLGSLLI